MRIATGVFTALISIASATDGSAADSALVRFDIVGALTNISGIHPPPADTPSIGSPFSGSFVFNVNVDPNGSEFFGIYHTSFPVGVISLKVGDWEWKETGEAPVTIIVGNDVVRSGGGGIVDSYHVGDSRVERIVPAEPLGAYWLFRWNLEGPTSIFATTDLPRSAFALEPWTTNKWSISNWDTPPAPLLDLTGSVTSFQAVALTDFADFNGDGFVDADDLTIWKAGVGEPAGATLNDGDADGDRDVDGSDFLVWQRQLNPMNAGATSAVVPEPACPSLLAIGLAALAARRRVR